MKNCIVNMGMCQFANVPMRMNSTLAHRQISILRKKRRTHRYDHISLLRFRPGEVLQELVARRRRKGKKVRREKISIVYQDLSARADFYICPPKFVQK